MPCAAFVVSTGLPWRVEKGFPPLYGLPVESAKCKSEGEMNMKKRLLPLMLALALCLGLAVPALAAEKEAEEAYEVVIPCEMVNVGRMWRLETGTASSTRPARS